MSPLLPVRPLPRRRPSRSPSGLRPGFTFVEVVIVMIIMGLVAAMSVVGLRKATNGNRVKRAAQLVSTDLQYAFALASARREPINIIFDSDSVRYRFVSRSGTTFFTRQLGITSELKFRAGQVTFSANTLAVFPRGLAADTLRVQITETSDTGRVWLARGGTTRIR